MKKMLNFKYVIVGFLLVLCGACSDFLDLEPKTLIPQHYYKIFFLST